MTTKEIKQNGIKVGNYYVVRRGRRILVTTPGEMCGCGIETCEVSMSPPETQLALTEKQALGALESYNRLRKKQKEHDGLQDGIDEIESKIYALEDEKSDLEEKQSEGVMEYISGYNVILADDGIEFGCTNVPVKTMKKIRNLIEKGATK